MQLMSGGRQREGQRDREEVSGGRPEGQGRLGARRSICQAGFKGFIIIIIIIAFSFLFCFRQLGKAFTF